MPPASFDTWTTLFLFAAVQGLFVALVLVLAKNAKPFVMGSNRFSSAAIQS